ncbi:hypothetical protein ACFX2C_000277 [Malus domestica]
MKQQATCIQAECPKCCRTFSLEKPFVVSIVDDWRSPYLTFFIDGTLPSNVRDACKLKGIVQRHFMDRATVYRKGFNGEPLRDLGLSESSQVMQKVHAGECGEHQGMKKLHKQLLNLGYYWPTMREDTHNMVKQCHACQVHGNLIHKPPTLLQDMRTSWLFHTWGLNLIETINLASEVSATLDAYRIKHCCSTPYYP